jgi:serine/threonine protein kinase
MRQEFRYDDFLGALMREMAWSASRLQHPNVVQVYDAGKQDGRPFFTMELLPGGSLADKPDMPVWEAVELVQTLARAMDAAHRNNIIHGNLKPSKVLFADTGTPKITGFLFDRQERYKGEVEAVLRTMADPPVMGTPRYMAPEHWSGINAIEPATDVYALGLILYELLTGRLPFRAAMFWEMKAQVLHEAPQPPGELRADLAPELGAICLRCLAKRPEQRYLSAGALAYDLDCFLVGKPLVPTAGPDPRTSTGPTPDEQSAPQPGIWVRVAEWFVGRQRK